MRATLALHRSTFMSVLLLAAIPWAYAAGQVGHTPRPGEQVRVRIVSSETARIGTLCAGSVAAVVGDTVVLGQPRSCPGGSHLAALRIARGDRGSRLAHTGLGLVGGALVGGIFAKLAVGDGCVSDVCAPADGAYAAAIVTMAGAVAGGLVGALVGVALPAGQQWVETAGTRPLVVAGVEVRPGVRVSLDDRAGR